MKTDNIILSIIVPIFNVEKYITDCIASLYRQDFNDGEFEIIFINDGSTDKSIAMIAPFTKTHENIKIVHQNNQGQAAARNNAMNYAVGEYIFFIDSDDMLADYSLKPLLSQLIECKADTIEGGYIKIENKKIPHNGIILNSPANIQITSGAERFANDSVCDCYIWQNIYKRDFLISAGLEFVTGIYFEDVAYYSEMMLKAKRYAISSIKHYVYRQREGSTVSTMNKQKLIHMNIAGEHIWNNCKEIAINDIYCYDALVNRIFYNTVLINFWYVTHYKNIFPYWREILTDLKSRIPLKIFNITFKQRVIIAFLKYIPAIYLYTRYKLNRKKY